MNMKYYYTTLGEVYVGYEFDEMNFSDYKIVVQANKLKKYLELNFNDKTLEKIKEYSNVLPHSSIVDVIDESVIPNKRIQQNENWWNNEFNRKNMFIIGAGASAFCVAGNRKEEFKYDDLRPPLGNELFARRFKALYEKYEGVTLSLFDLQSGNINVEEFLEEEWKEVQEFGNHSVMSRHINIQFYLQELLMTTALNT